MNQSSACLNLPPMLVTFHFTENQVKIITNYFTDKVRLDHLMPKYRTGQFKTFNVFIKMANFFSQNLINWLKNFKFGEKIKIWFQEPKGLKGTNWKTKKSGTKSATNSSSSRTQLRELTSTKQTGKERHRDRVSYFKFSLGWSST